MNYPRAYGYAKASMEELHALAEAGAEHSLIARVAQQRIEQSEARVCDLYPCVDAAAYGEWLCGKCSRREQ